VGHHRFEGLQSVIVAGKVVKEVVDKTLASLNVSDLFGGVENIADVVDGGLIHDLSLRPARNVFVLDDPSDIGFHEFAHGIAVSGAHVQKVDAVAKQAFGLSFRKIPPVVFVQDEIFPAFQIERDIRKNFRLYDLDCDRNVKS
jgi:hypothetical protein